MRFKYFIGVPGFSAWANNMLDAFYGGSSTAVPSGFRPTLGPTH